MVEENNNSSDLTEWFISSVGKMYPDTADSVCHWLADLRSMTDTECMCVLQGKSLSKDTHDIHMLATRSGKECIDMIKGRAHIISAEFTKLYKKMEKERWKQVRPASVKLTCQIRSLLHECNSLIPSPPHSFTKQQQTVMEACAKLAQYVESTMSDGDDCGAERVLVTQLLTQLGAAFSGLVDMALSTLIQDLLDQVLESSSAFMVRSALTDLVSLGLEGDHMCYIIAREGGVEALFNVCRDQQMESCHAQALRAIATVCCVPESIQHLEQLGGIERLSEVLSTPHETEAVRCEAAGVVAQITSPCLDRHLAPGFIEHMDDLVRSLTDLCLEASSHEVFLLGCAALANMTFMDTMACDILLLYHTAQVLVHACHTPNAQSLYAKDQVVTVLANMSGVELCHEELVDCEALPLLVSFLYLPPPDLHSATEPELSAFEHVQQKSAIAITRLAKDAEVAKTLAELNIIPRLVEMCKVPSERHNSDAVLVACLAALRKICSQYQDIKVNEDDDLSQLIQPKLMESFVLCSSGHDESIV